jgi:hypothetical protein
MKTRGKATVRKQANGEAGLVPAGRSKRRDLGAKYAQLLVVHHRNEARLARMMRAWDKSRAALRRAEKRLDKAFIEQAHRENAPPEFDDDVR